MRYRSTVAKIIFPLAAAIFISFNGSAAGPQTVEITPTTFDFGWAPDNAKISAEFSIRNTGTDMIPLTSVQPTCGCTASHFSPANLAAQEETKVGLTFNTRGYTNTSFTKAAKVKTDVAETEYSVQLTGHVTDPAAVFVPVGDGIAGFEPSAKDKKKTIEIENKSPKEVKLEIVQKPATWAKAKLDADVLKAGQKGKIEISVDGSLDEARDSSVTIAAADDTGVHRLTIAIRTGPAPESYRKPNAPMVTPPTPPKNKP